MGLVILFLGIGDTVSDSFGFWCIFVDWSALCDCPLEDNMLWQSADLADFTKIK
jgi:hypothetical protein